MCSGNACVPQTTNQGSPCKCLNMVESLLPPWNSTWAFSFFWSPDQTHLLPALCECLSPTLPKGRGKSSNFPEIQPGPSPPSSLDQICPSNLRWNSSVMFMSTHLREGNSDNKPATETITGHLAFACHQVITVEG